MTRTVAPIKEFALGIYDGPHATPKPADEGPIFLGIKNVTEEGRLDFSEIRHVSESEFDTWTRRVIPRNDDIVFSYEASLHRYARIPDGFEGCLGRRMALVRPDIEKVDPRFLLYYFLSPIWRAKMDAITIAGATVNRIPLTTFPNTEVSFPGLNEQTAIADVLSSYDDLIENNRRRMALLDEAARMLYCEWFVRFRFPGHEHVRFVKGIPETWGTNPLSDLCRHGDGIQTGPFGSQLHQSDYTNSGVPVVMPKDLIGFRIESKGIARIPEDLADRLGRHRMEVGDTVYGRRGDIGRRAFIERRQAGWFCGTGCLRIRPDPAKIVPRYLFETLGSQQTAGFIANQAKGSTMPNLSAGALQKVPVLTPPMSLQKLFVEEVSPMFELIETLSEQSQKLAEARGLLLPRLMNGQIEM